MKTIIRNYFPIFLSLVIILSLVSCNEDGPQSEADRIKTILTSGDWAITQVFSDSNQTEKYKTSTMHFAPEQIVDVTGANIAYQGDWAIKKYSGPSNWLTMTYSDTTIVFGGDWRIVDYTKHDVRMEGAPGKPSIRKLSITRITP